MRKLKVYLDTSVISYLYQEDALEKMEDTLQLWEDLRVGKFEICISDLTLTEIDRCPEPKRTYMLRRLLEISYKMLAKDDEALQLSDLYFKAGGLPPKSKEDALHLAVASVNDCDIVLSWNFKHIVNLRAMTAVEAVNIANKYRPLRILSPTMLLDKED